MHPHIISERKCSEYKDNDLFFILPYESTDMPALLNLRKAFGSMKRKIMSVYMIIDSKVRDAQKYDQYIEQVVPIVEKFGGRYHVRSEKIKSLGTWKPERIIVIEFPSETDIRNWLASPEYGAIAPLRELGAETQAILVDGYPNIQKGPNL